MKRLACILLLPLAACAKCGSSASTEVDASSAVAAPIDSGIPPDTIVTEAEREKYVQEFLEVTGLDVGPDVKPGDDGGVVPVGGLYKAAGVVKNKGTQAVKNAMITLSLQDSSGKVIGTYFHDIVGNKRLAPGEERAFKFTIPEKKEYGGKFSHILR